MCEKTRRNVNPDWGREPPDLERECPDRTREFRARNTGVGRCIEVNREPSDVRFRFSVMRCVRAEAFEASPQSHNVRDDYQVGKPVLVLQ